MSVISREAAIKAFYIQSDDDGWWVGTAKDAETLLNGLPTAEKVGKWIDEETNYSCSECHRGCWVNSDYCPWCGARMVRGEEDE